MFILKFIIRNMFRHKLRLALTVTAVAVAVLAFGLLRTLVGLWYLGVERSSANRLVTRNAISLTFSLPISYKDKIRQIAGVKAVSYGNFFGGIYIDEKHFFANYAVEPESYLGLYPEIVLTSEQKRAFMTDRKGCVVGQKLAATYGWKIGDQITLKGTIFPGQWEFVLRGIYRGADKSVDERALIFQWVYLNEIMKKVSPRRADQVGFYMIGIADAEQAAQVSVDVDGSFKNSLAETLTETERAFHMGFISMTEAILVIIKIVSYVVIVIIMAVTANTMAMTARERIREFATLKTLGFGIIHIALIVFGESLAICLSGGLLGVLLTFPAANWVETELSQYFPSFSVATETILLDFLLAALVGATAGIFPVWRAATIRIIDGIRRIG